MLLSAAAQWISAGHPADQAQCELPVLTAALRLVVFASTLTCTTQLSRTTATCHSCAFSQDLAAALELMLFASTLACTIPLVRTNADCHSCLLASLGCRIRADGIRFDFGLYHPAEQDECELTLLSRLVGTGCRYSRWCPLRRAWHPARRGQCKLPLLPLLVGVDCGTITYGVRFDVRVASH